MASETPVAVERTDEVTVVRIDDGKANALSPSLVDTLLAVITEAADDPGALVIAGRPGKFCAGFDLSVMTSGIDAARDLLRRGTDLLLTIYGHPRPVVAAATGHAIAAGALLLLATDLRVGPSGTDTPTKVGLNEHAIGMPLPEFALELARDRLSVRHFTRATALAEIYEPPGAVDAGWLDELAADPVATAIERAASLTAALDMGAFAATREKVRGDLIRRVRAGLEQDLAGFSVADRDG